WVAACGGVRPRRGRDLQGRYLSFAEREEIALARARGEAMRGIARRLGRSPATVSRELRRNADRHGGYRAITAHALAWERAGQRKNRIPDMINISQRPPEAKDRAVPGHWEGDLLIGRRNATAIATLVERSTGYAMLVSLPDGYKPEHVAPALATKIQTLPEAL